MRLISVHLKNFCQHRDIKVDFASDLTAIIGPNGSGKSNLLEAVYFALTGDVRKHGINSDNICQYASEKEHSFVDLVFMHGAAKIRVKRGLRPNTICLNIPNKAEIKKVSEANEELEKIIGLPGRILSDFIFVEQKGLAAFFSMKPADRAIALQRLFGTHHCESAYAAISNRLRSVVIPSPAVDINLVKARVKESKKKLAVYEKNLKLCPVPQDWDMANDPDAIITNKLKTAGAIDNELVQLELDLNRAQEIRAALLLDISTKSKDLQRLESKIAGFDSDNIHRLMSDVAVYKQNKAHQDRLLRESAKLETEGERNVHPGDPPEDFLDGQELIEFYQETKSLESELANLEGFVTTFDSTSGTVICPTCDEPVSIDKVESKLSEFNSLQTEVASRKERLKRSKNYSELVSRYESWRKEYAKRVDYVVQELSALGDVSEPEFSIDELETKLRELKTLERNKELLEKVINSKSIELAKCENQIENVSTNIANKRFEREEIDIDADKASRAAERLKKKSEAYQRRLKLNAEIETISQSIEDDVKALKIALAIAQKAEKTREWVDVMENMRNIFHKSSLPNMISQHYLDSLEGDINTILSELSATFRVKTSENLGFIANFTDGRTQPVERLSVGEQTVLALALRIVVNTTFAGDIGLLCLDEPTEGLDQDNLKGLEIALQRLQSLSRDRGLQCILITHEKALLPLFDNKLELQAPV